MCEIHVTPIMVPNARASDIFTLHILLKLDPPTVKGPHAVSRRINHTVKKLLVNQPLTSFNAFSIAVIIAVLIFTGAWDYIKYELFEGGANNELITNITFIIITVIAIFAIAWGSGKSSGEPSKASS